MVFSSSSRSLRRFALRSSSRASESSTESHTLGFRCALLDRHLTPDSCWSTHYFACPEWFHRAVVFPLRVSGWRAKLQASSHSFWCHSTDQQTFHVTYLLPQGWQVSERQLKSLMYLEYSMFTKTFPLINVEGALTQNQLFMLFQIDFLTQNFNIKQSVHALSNLKLLIISFLKIYFCTRTTMFFSSHAFSLKLIFKLLDFIAKNTDDLTHKNLESFLILALPSQKSLRRGCHNYFRCFAFRIFSSLDIIKMIYSYCW